MAPELLPPLVLLLQKPLVRPFWSDMLMRLMRGKSQVLSNPEYWGPSDCNIYHKHLAIQIWGPSESRQRVGGVQGCKSLLEVADSKAD